MASLGTRRSSADGAHPPPASAGAGLACPIAAPGAEAYVSAARAVIDAIEEGTAVLESVVHPVAHLSRHYLGLAFKNLVYLCRQGQGRGDRIQSDDPRELWAEARRLVRRRLGPDCSLELDQIGRWCERTDYLDPGRLVKAFSPDGGGEGLLGVNVFELYESMETLAELLDRLSDKVYAAGPAGLT